MKLEILKGSYFIFDEMLYENIYGLQQWLYSNGFEASIERQQVSRDVPISIPFSSPLYGTLDNPYYIENRQEIGCILHYRYFNSFYRDYKTEFIKNGTCIINTGSHLLFLESGEYEILQTGLKILPNE